MSIDTSTVWVLLVFVCCVADVTAQIEGDSSYERDLIITIVTASSILVTAIIFMVCLGYIFYKKRLKKIEKRAKMRMLIDKENRSKIIEMPDKITTLYNYFKQQDTDITASFDAFNMERRNSRNIDEISNGRDTNKSLDILFTTEDDRKRLLDSLRVPEKVQQLYDEHSNDDYTDNTDRTSGSIEYPKEDKHRAGARVDSPGDVVKGETETSISGTGKTVTQSEEDLWGESEDTVSDETNTFGNGESGNIVCREHREMDSETHEQNETVVKPESKHEPMAKPVSKDEPQTTFLDNPDIDAFFSPKHISKGGKKRLKHRKYMYKSSPSIRTGYTSKELFKLLEKLGSVKRKKVRSRKTSSKVSPKLDDFYNETRMSCVPRSKIESNMHSPLSDRRYVDKTGSRRRSMKSVSSTLESVPMQMYSPRSRPHSRMRSISRASTSSQPYITNASVSDIGLAWGKNNWRH